MKTVTLYTRPGCHLCDDARAALEKLRTNHEFQLTEIDIETDDALHAAYAGEAVAPSGPSLVPDQGPVGPVVITDDSYAEADLTDGVDGADEVDEADEADRLDASPNGQVAASLDELGEHEVDDQPALN